MPPNPKGAALSDEAREARRQERIEKDVKRIDDAIAKVETEMAYGGEYALSGAKVLVPLLERRARLLGLDAPTRQEVTGRDGAPIEVDARQVLIQSLTVMAGKLTPAQVRETPLLAVVTRGDDDGDSRPPAAKPS